MDFMSSKSANRIVLGAIVVLAYIFLYVPILHITLASFSRDIVWPYPIRFTWNGYLALMKGSIYHEAFLNSTILGLGTAVISMLD